MRGSVTSLRFVLALLSCSACASGSASSSPSRAGLPDPATLVPVAYLRLSGAASDDPRSAAVVIRRGDRPFRSDVDYITVKFSDPDVRAWVKSSRQVDIIDHSLVVLHGSPPVLSPQLVARLGVPRPISATAQELAEVAGHAVFRQADGAWVLAGWPATPRVRAWLATPGAALRPLAIPDDVGYLMFVPTRGDPPGESFAMQMAKTNGDVVAWLRYPKRGSTDGSESITVTHPGEGRR